MRDERTSVLNLPKNVWSKKNLCKCFQLMKVDTARNIKSILQSIAAFWILQYRRCKDFSMSSDDLPFKRCFGVGTTKRKKSKFYPPVPSKCYQWIITCFVLLPEFMLTLYHWNIPILPSSSKPLLQLNWDPDSKSSYLNKESGETHSQLDCSLHIHTK